MKIISKHWFTGVNCFGIVVIENEVGERKAYLGLGRGNNETEDADGIAFNGVPVIKTQVEQLLKELEGK